MKQTRQNGDLKRAKVFAETNVHFSSRWIDRGYRSQVGTFGRLKHPLEIGGLMVYCVKNAILRTLLANKKRKK